MGNLAGTITLLSMLLILPVSAAHAKGAGRLAGNIKSVSGNPLGNALIRIFREMQRGELVLVARSDSRGSFKSTSLTPGAYYLEVSRQGYQPITATKFTIDPGQTTSLDIILQDLIEYIDRDEDPRNWDLKTVMRSTSDRRLIFRDLPGKTPSLVADNESPFYRSGAMSIASSTPLNGESYLLHPQSSQNGVTSSFAFSEPLSQHSRMILSGQADFGASTFWRLRNTFNYRPNNSHDYQISVGYGRMNVNYPSSAGTLTSQLIPKESEARESGVETLAFGLEGNTKFLDLLAIKYGFDYARLHYGNSRSFVNPSVQILITPSKGWTIRTSYIAPRASDSNTVVLPDGETLDLSEPTLITMLGNHVSMSQIRHSEIAAQRTINDETDVEIAVYQDRIHGPGLPVMVTTITPVDRKSQVVQMNEDSSNQRGARLSVRRKIIDNLNGSVAYVYGSSTTISNLNNLSSGDCLNGSLVGYLRQRYQHSITGQLNAKIPVTKTNLLAVLRWYSGNSLTPVDWVFDRMDIGTKSARFELRQTIPFPDIMGTDGQWNVWVDVRNVLNQGKEVLPVTDGEVVFNRNPRSLRFGLSLNFR